MSSHVMSSHLVVFNQLHALTLLIVNVNALTTSFGVSKVLFHGGIGFYPTNSATFSFCPVSEIAQQKNCGAWLLLEPSSIVLFDRYRNVPCIIHFHV